MAASVFCCLRCCRDGGTGHIPLKEMPAVQLDTQHMGTDVVIVKNGRRICGTGGCLASAPLHQNKSYFEFKIQSTGIWGIGVATQKVNLNQIPLGRDVHSLVMRNDGALYHNNEEKNRLPANSLPQEGDVVGITYDHVELNVYLNGKNMHCPASGIRGTVYPVVYGMVSRGLLPVKKDSLLRFRRGEGTPCHTGTHRTVLLDMASPVAQMVKNLPAMQKTQV
ncbi:SPRY domain-containing protein 7 isoform X2 [Bubalus kerabau]|uniref:SPRY domain-containing protein 7 isoform X2 n=1 Tax=Bubalus carabanensis TaxID=3119969 RepID=UPI00244ED4AC|nr:SPRY domain-containing protein 7 isoform X2 [Bubalus carabanensis]